jgi:hypothetical protein
MDQLGRSVISLPSLRGHFRPDPEAQSSVQECWAVLAQIMELSSGAVRAQMVFRSLVSVFILLDQEEESVRLVPEELSSELSVLIKIC